MVNKRRINEELRELSLFAGAGGGILGGHLLGWKTVCAVECMSYPASVLVARQNDGILPPFPIWDDVQTFDGSAWRGFVDVVSGGFPCQDISSAGKGAGITGAKSGMWSHMARIIGEVQPKYAFIENSPMLTVRGLDRVLCDLAEIGYDAQWGCLSAAQLGGNHIRDRIWILGYSNSHSKSDLPVNDEMAVMQKSNGIIDAYPDSAQLERGSIPVGVQQKDSDSGNSLWWENKPEFHRMDDGMADWMDRLKAIGNGQVPVVAGTAFNKLIKRISNSD